MPYSGIPELQSNSRSPLGCQPRGERPLWGEIRTGWNIALEYGISWILVNTKIKTRNNANQVGEVTQRCERERSLQTRSSTAHPFDGTDGTAPVFGWYLRPANLSEGQRIEVNYGTGWLVGGRWGLGFRGRSACKDRFRLWKIDSGSAGPRNISAYLKISATERWTGVPLRRIGSALSDLRISLSAFEIFCFNEHLCVVQLTATKFHPTRENPRLCVIRVAALIHTNSEIPGRIGIFVPSCEFNVGTGPVVARRNQGGWVLLRGWKVRRQVLTKEGEVGQVLMIEDRLWYSLCGWTVSILKAGLCYASL